MEELQDLHTFIENLYNNLAQLNIDTSRFAIDHVAYQASSAEDYNKMLNTFSELGTLVSENIVGKRRVGILKLKKPVTYKKNIFNVIEVIEPKEGQEAKSSWEHIEFLTDITLEKLIYKYQDLNWDISVLNRDEFPMLILHLGNDYRAKFPRLGVLDEQARLTSGN